MVNVNKYMDPMGYDHLQSVLTHISIELPFCHVDDDQNPVSNQYQMLATWTFRRGCGWPKIIDLVT